MCADRIAKMGRLDLVKSVLNSCLELGLGASQTVPVTVSSAVGLSEAQKARIVKALPKYTNSANFSVEFEVRF